jgi:predicted aspartyl protease
VRGRRLPLTALAALLVAAAACARPGVVASSVAIERDLRVTAAVGGSEVRARLDSGSTRTVLSRACVDRLGLPLRAAPDVSVLDATGAERRVDGVVRVEGLTIGANRWSPFDALCVPFAPQLTDDAVVGMDVLGSAVWCVDAGGKRLELRDAAAAEEVVAALGLRVLAKTSLGPDAFRPRVNVRLEDRVDVALLLDTGADVTTLPADVVAQLGLPPGEELARQRAAAEAVAANLQLQRQGVSGTITVNPPDGGWVGAHGVSVQRPLHHLRALALAGRRVTDLVVAASEHEGALGRDVLGSVPFLLHGPRRELWLLQRP